jgi:hypothetical protein
MATLGDVLDEVSAIVREQLDLPAPTDGTINLLTSVQAAKQSFLEAAKQGTVTLPCAVIQVGDFMPDAQWGLGGGASRAPLTIHYLEPWGPDGNQRTIAEAMRTLKLAIHPKEEFENFQVVEEGAVLTDVDSPVNAELFVKAKSSSIAGCLSFQPGLLVFNG